MLTAKIYVLNGAGRYFAVVKDETIEASLGSAGFDVDASALSLVGVDLGNVYLIGGISRRVEIDIVWIQFATEERKR